MAIALTTESFTGEIKSGASGARFFGPRRPRRCRRCRSPFAIRPLFGVIGEGILAVGHPVAVESGDWTTTAWVSW